jgi:hypothetical protein
MAESLHRGVTARFGRYYPAKGYKALFSALNTKANVATVAARVIKLVRKLRDKSEV